jgi:sortase A
MLAGAGLCALGLAAVADAVLATVWEEPVTALQAGSAQRDLSHEYASLTASYATVRASSYRGGMLERARRARELLDATPNGKPLGRLLIPKIHLKTVWVDGTDHDDLKRGPGHYDGTVLPGRRGTVGLAGHRTTYGAPFRNVNQLKPGDRITLAMPYGRYEYAVERTQIVSPKAAEVLRRSGSDRLVLTACHPLWSAAQRIVVTARLIRWPGATKDAPLLTAAPTAPELQSHLPTLSARPD